MFLFVVILLFGSVPAGTHAYMRTQPTKVVKKNGKIHFESDRAWKNSDFVSLAAA